MTLSVSCDKEIAKDCGIKINGELKKTYEVEGLTERIELDAFDNPFFNTEDGIEISYSGRDPFGRILIENHLSRSEPLSKVIYKADKTENIKKGDKITITAELSSGLEADRILSQRNVHGCDSRKYRPVSVGTHRTGYMGTDRAILRPGNYRRIERNIFHYGRGGQLSL